MEDAKEDGRHPEVFWTDYLTAKEKELRYGEPIYIAGFEELRGFVRHVELKQAGHWMTGFTPIAGEKIYLSGDYGGDGLPKTLPRHVWVEGVPLPDALTQEIAKGEGGHNCAGSEAPNVKSWALANLEKLKQAGLRAGDGL